MILIKGLKLNHYSNQDMKYINYPNLTFLKRKINLLIGNNGSGKSTLGNYLFNINSVEKSEGNLTYNSKELVESLVNFNFKHIPQERPFMPNVTCKEIREVYYNSTKKNMLNGITFDKELLNKQFSTISTGEWKKFLLKTIIYLPELNGVFLDEIFAGLQDNNKLEIMNLLIKNTIERDLITIVTHIFLNNNDFLILNLNKYNNYVNKIYL